MTLGTLGVLGAGEKWGTGAWYKTDLQLCCTTAWPPSPHLPSALLSAGGSKTCSGSDPLRDATQGLKLHLASELAVPHSGSSIV